MNINKKEQAASERERETERRALNMYKNRKSETKQNEFYLTFWVKFQFFFLSARNIEINVGPHWGNVGRGWAWWLPFCDVRAPST